VPAFAVRITVAGRVGPALESALGDFTAEVCPGHTIVSVTPDALPHVVQVLMSLEQRDAQLDRILRSTCTRRG
jgi:hypothetical protein